MKIKHFDRAEILNVDDDLFILVIVDKHGKISTIQNFETKKDAENAADMLYTFLAQDSPNDLTLTDFKKEISTVATAIASGDVTDDDVKNLSTEEIFNKAKRHFN